jgi:hypothetical protein
VLQPLKSVLGPVKFMEETYSKLRSLWGKKFADNVISRAKSYFQEPSENEVLAIAISVLLEKIEDGEIPVSQS